MNIENAKKISLVELMGLWSYKPVKTNGVYVLYHAPYRVDKHASFKVDCLKNEWYDFSTGKGGDIIDLCKLVFNPRGAYALFNQGFASPRFVFVFAKSWYRHRYR